MKEFFKEWNPNSKSAELVSIAENIINEYQAAGYILTLRQLYYQFVARDIIVNSERSYKNLGNVITKARMSGMISWEAIEDRNREHHRFWYEEDEREVLNGIEYQLRMDRWARQSTYIEVWVEKEALGNVVSRACNPLLVPHMACKGYLSASEAWRAGKRFEKKIDEGKNCILIHLGDHDPSGIDMTRDNSERANLFSYSDQGVEVRRIALNMDQVDEYSPPPNPAKVTDSRAKDYISQYGRTSWELDALEPQVIEQLITDEVEQYIDPDLWDEIENEQYNKREVLAKLYRNWDHIKNQLDV